MPSGTNLSQSWTFQGSNDNVTYIALDTRSNMVAGPLQSFTFSNTTAYRYYRLNISSAMYISNSSPAPAQIHTLNILGSSATPPTGCQADGPDTDTVTGNLLADPTGMTGTTVSGCANTATYTPTASLSILTETITSASLVTVGNAQSCKINLSGGILRQSIPAGQTPGTYTIGLTFTAV